MCLVKQEKKDRAFIDCQQENSASCAKKRATVGGRENKAFSRTRGQRPPTRRRAQAQKTGFNKNKKRVTFGERENRAFSRTRRQRRPKRPRAKKDKI